MDIIKNNKEFCSFYTKSRYIIEYMINKLDIKEQDFILEPSAGDGSFIKEIFNKKPCSNIFLEAIDIDEKAINKLMNEYGNKISIRNVDTLLDNDLDLYSDMGGIYNKIIGNPPYGAYQNANKKKILKKKYKIYSNETYILFLIRCISLLKKDGKLVFIIPDTFLSLNVFSDVRKYLLEKVVIEEILLIPTNFFYGVNFGYSNLCIISIIKKININNIIKIISVYKDEKILLELSKGIYKDVDMCQNIQQKDIFDSKNCYFLLGSNYKVRDLINNSDLYVKDIADCVTGFCSGDNYRFIKTMNNNSKYEVIENDKIQFYISDNILEGTEKEFQYIPYLKGGKYRFKKPTELFIKWDVNTVKYYKNNPKSRFQNSKFYFKQGLGIPMVKSNIIVSFLLDNRLFDQSIVGIFPKNLDNLYFLLGFFNSDVCNRIIKYINHTANNSANYIKNIPIIYSDTNNTYVKSIVDSYIIGDISIDTTLKEINSIFNNIYRNYI